MIVVTSLVIVHMSKLDFAVCVGDTSAVLKIV